MSTTVYVQVTAIYIVEIEQDEYNEQAAIDYALLNYHECGSAPELEATVETVQGDDDATYEAMLIEAQLDERDNPTEPEDDGYFGPPYTDGGV